MLVIMYKIVVNIYEIPVRVLEDGDRDITRIRWNRVKYDDTKRNRNQNRSAGQEL